VAKRHAFAVAFVIAISSLIPAILTAQAQTGTLQGTVKDQSDAVLPGVTVSVTSPALQGTRETVSDGNGVYTIPALPPGVYTVRFELAGFAPVVHDNAIVPLGSVGVIDALMQVATLTEVVNVTAQTSNALVVPTGQTNLTSRELNTIPVGRTPVRIAEFAPGLTDNAPNFGQVTISGGFAYDNVFLLNGVDLNDNLFGTANNVFIEDAIEETQVMTSGISAEYGRFSGGVINMITKSGGNTFSGSVRLNFTNPSWSNESPLQKSRNQTNPDSLSKFLEGTFGGPVFRDRVWFFTAGRRERSSLSSTTVNTNMPFTPKTVNDRYEIKITGTPHNNHTIQGSYIDNSTEQLGRASLNTGLSLDTTVLVDAKQPNKLFVANYNGVLGSRVLVNGQYSRKDWQIQLGGASTALADSPFRARGVASGTASGQHYHAPFFSALDPEDRNNNQYSGSIAYFLTTRRTGTHNLKAGGENFTSSRVGGNSQSATNYVFLSDYLVTGGVTVLDAQGRLIPLFVPGVSQVQNWLPTPGATMDLTTLSFYVQDRWAASDNLSFDLGIRFETANSEATGDIVGADTHSIVPRLGVTFDPRGDGRTTLQATYAHYSGKYSDVQYARNTAVGSPSRITYQYTGPAGQGFDFAPGMDLANYPTIVSGNFPTANVFLADGLESPLTKEFTLSAGRQFAKGYGRVMYTWRHASNFIEDFIDDPSAAGKIPVVRNGVNFGTFDRLEFRNSNDVERRYQAMQFIGRYDLSRTLYVNGHYTLQLENNGNFEGEATNQPANPSDLGDYPEILTSRSFPDGKLNDFQRSKVRLWAVYNQSLGRAGTVTLGPIWRYNSAQTYSLFASAVPLSAVQLARNPGYARLPGGGVQTLYFAERGTESFEGYGLVDLAATYEIGIWKTLRPWIKFELYNIFDNNKLIGWNTAVNPDPNSPLDANGLPTGYIRPANFGTPRANSDYPRPIPGVDGGRTFQMAMGLRF
jgi:outer membrane receptor protein involved in Fe transport